MQPYPGNVFASVMIWVSYNTLNHIWSCGPNEPMAKSEEETPRANLRYWRMGLQVLQCKIEYELYLKWPIKMIITLSLRHTTCVARSNTFPSNWPRHEPTTDLSYFSYSARAARVFPSLASTSKYCSWLSEWQFLRWASLLVLELSADLTTFSYRKRVTNSSEPPGLRYVADWRQFETPFCLKWEQSSSSAHPIRFPIRSPPRFLCPQDLKNRRYRQTSLQESRLRKGHLLESVPV